MVFRSDVNSVKGYGSRKIHNFANPLIVDMALAQKPISKSKMASIGFHVRSGYAIVLVVTGDVDSPHPVSRSIVELSDPHLPETKQPYHARMGTLETDNAKINKRKMI